MQTLSIEYVPIDTLHAYKKNAKQHPKEQVQQIAQSIVQFGMNDPIAIDETNTIIEGHGRMLAIRKLHQEGTGPYDIPALQKTTKLPKITRWIGFNEVLSDTKPKSHTGVHFFVDDYQFERIWNRPDDYIPQLKKYACVASPDFSPYGDMPLITQMFNHYRKHWVG